METVPSILYHYTSQKGFLGIIKSKTVWATDILFLNDTMEYKYSVDLAIEIIKERMKVPPDKPPRIVLSHINPEKDKGASSTLPVPQIENRYEENWIEHNMLDDFRDIIQVFEKSHIFVFSLSEDGDLLSQWRGYCPHGNGYSIGFKTSAFGELMKAKGLKFVKCIYKKKEQEKIVKNILDNYVIDIRSKFNELSNSEDKRKDLLKAYLIRFLNIASKIKSESFEEEKEWRIVSQPLKETDFIKFREGRSTIIPYININIAENGLVPIEKFIISPTSQKQLSDYAVNFLLSCKDLKPCSVEISKISYRAT